MKIITIPKELLIHPSNYMQVEGKYDLLGCLLLELYGVSIGDKCKFPSQLKRHLPPFTVEFRRAILDSPLTLSILRLSVFPTKEVLAPLNRLLEPHLLKVVIV
jgi:hypothetical protein